MDEFNGNPLYGRKWRIQVLRKNGNEAWVISDSTYDTAEEANTGRAPLKCVFQVHKQYGQAYWQGVVEIWNLQGDTQAEIIKEGYAVRIEAGYKNGNYGKIFECEVFQPMFERRNVTDFVTTLHCLDGMGILHANFVSFTQAAGYDYAGVVNEMARQARNPIPVGGVTPSLKPEKAPRGAVFFGDPRDHYRDVATDNNAQWFVSEGKLYVANLEDPYEKEALKLTPETGLVGSPIQTQDGVQFRCLLNPNLNVKQPLMVVKLDQAVIRQMKATLGSTPPSPLDQDGYYKVIGVSHYGDTRGNDWYTEVLGVNLVGKGSALLLKPGGTQSS